MRHPGSKPDPKAKFCSGCKHVQSQHRASNRYVGKDTPGVRVYKECLVCRCIGYRRETPSDAELDALAVARKWVVDGRVQF